MTKFSLAVLALFLCTLAFAAKSFAADKPAPGQSGKKEILLQADQSWNGKPYAPYPGGVPELTMIKLTIAPHSVLPWHIHPMINAAYVLSGTLTVHDRASGKTKTVHAGEAFAESVNDEHRGESGDEPAVLIITYAGTKGVPTSIPAKGEKAEY